MSNSVIALQGTAEVVIPANESIALLSITQTNVFKVVGFPNYPEQNDLESTFTGYKGEKVVMLAATDLANVHALGQVGHDMLKKCGLNVDYVATDWGTVVARRASKEPPERGGWSIFFTFWTGLDVIDPGVNQTVRGNGDRGWWGWFSSPKLEALRSQWFDAPDLAAQKAVARQIQEVAFQEVPYLPLGQYFQATAYRRGLTGVLKGLPLFWNVQRG